MYCIWVNGCYRAAGDGHHLAVLQPLREAEVDQLQRVDVARVLEQHVVELYVPMVDIEGVQVNNRGGYLPEDLAGVLLGYVTLPDLVQQIPALAQPS